MKLLIENFYNIKHAELEFKKFNILIGPQAAGKSLIAKVLYFLFEATSFYNLSSVNELARETVNQKLNSIFTSIFEQSSLDNDFKIKLDFGKLIHITCDRNGITTSENYIDASQSFIPELKQAIKAIHNAPEEHIEAYIHLLIESSTDIKNAFGIFIPASRSLVNIVEQNLFWMPSNAIDYFLNRFGRLYFNQIKKCTEETNFKCKDLETIIKGSIERSNTQYLVNENGRKTKLANTSSGQQSTIPVIIALELLKSNKTPYTFIEEPEAHIFPEAQYLLTRYISEIHNQTNTNITLTTHSPYILTAVNNLIYAGTVGKQSEEKAAKVKEIIPESEWLNSEDVAAYMVEADGTIRSIMDEETGLIDADSIDDVSDVIGSEFNKILDIEFEEEAANA
ncbi:AAA family ATPase [Maridesulfovibrio sp.]|uniref:AAA family ATPase n=1 Tax=Maridesulfovibrio sp. TaxID=2795000 RepID=UPI0029CA8DDF|nr:AAA family ATPase [Maridesulfovibrio sp.]